MKKKLFILLFVAFALPAFAHHNTVTPPAPSAYANPAPLTPRTPPLQPLPTRRRRRKRQLAWEQTELANEGRYAQNFEAVCSVCPGLSLMEARVCALVCDALPNWKIAEMLGISERTVEGHLRSTRIKLGLPAGTKMHREIEQLLTAASV